LRVQSAGKPTNGKAVNCLPFDLNAMIGGQEIPAILPDAQGAVDVDQ
jgi:hypothetical protein